MFSEQITPLVRLRNAVWTMWNREHVLTGRGLARRPLSAWRVHINMTSHVAQCIHNRPYAYDVTEGRPRMLGSNEALSRAPSPSMQPAGQPLHAIPLGWPGPAHWLRGWARQRSSSTTCARSATSLDPQHGVVVMETWHQCIRSISHTAQTEMCAEFKSEWRGTETISQYS